MRRALAWVVVVAACSSGGGGKSKVRRDGGAGGPIRVVERAKPGVAAVAEREPNDEAGNAQAIAPPPAISGVIDREGDRDRYALNVTADGILTVSLSGTPDADLILDVEDVTGTVIARSDNGPAKQAEGIPNLPVRPGTYRLVVHEFVKKKSRQERTAPSSDYLLEVALAPVPASGEEIEPDDDPSYATELLLGAAGRGFIGWRDDVDVWKVPLEGAGEDVALSVDVDGVPGVALRVAVLDGTGGLLVERQGRAGEPVAVRNVAVREDEPYYFVSVRAKKANPDEQYVVRVLSVPFELDEESEPNDSPGAASALADIPGTDSGTRVGFLVRDDVDCYALEPATHPRRLSVTLEPPSSVDGVLAVVDEAGKDLVPPASAAKRGARERLADILVAPGAKVFVKLSAKAGESATERYRLRWSAPIDEAPPIPGMDEE